MAIRALIFDFDGVVIDTETPDFVMWQGVFDDHGVSLDRWLWETFIGAGMGSFDVSQHLEEMVGRSIDRDRIRPDRRARYLSAVEANPVLPGVTDLISGVRAAGLKLGVASSSRRDWVEGHLARRGLLDYFDAVRCLDDVSAAKPDPELAETRAVAPAFPLRRPRRDSAFPRDRHRRATISGTIISAGVKPPWSATFWRSS